MVVRQQLLSRIVLQGRCIAIRQTMWPPLGCVRHMSCVAGFRERTQGYKKQSFLKTKYCQNYLLQRSFSTKLVQELCNRGILKEVFPDDCPDLPHLLGSGQQCFYAGFDPTADSLHIGHLLVLMALLHAQREGHKIIALLGGATSRIGDPSGRTADRPRLLPTVVESNATSIKAILHGIFKNHKEIFWENCGRKGQLEEPLILNNISWYQKENVISFLSTVGRNFRMGELLSRTSVKSRLQSSNGMSFTEFTYQVFQSYDWLHLYNNHNCLFQIGGADQLGNIDSGHDLLKRMAQVNGYGLLVPLIMNEVGDKYGKSAGDAVWLKKDKTSPFEFYQYFLQLPDSKVEQYLRLFTFYESSDIKSILTKHMEKPDSRHGQKKIAESVTRLVHGEEGLASAKRATAALFHFDIESLSKLTKDEIDLTLRQVPHVNLLLEPGMTILDMAMKAKCFLTIEDAERIIRAGGFYVNHVQITQKDHVVVPDHYVLPNGITLLRVGKKKFSYVKWIK